MWLVETGKPFAQVARGLGVNDGTLGNWVAKARHERDELDRPRREVSGLRMQRGVLERSTALWVEEAVGR